MSNARVSNAPRHARRPSPPRPDDAAAMRRIQSCPDLTAGPTAPPPHPPRGHSPRANPVPPPPPSAAAAATTAAATAAAVLVAAAAAAPSPLLPPAAAAADAFLAELALPAPGIVSGQCHLLVGFPDELLHDRARQEAFAACAALPPEVDCPRETFIDRQGWRPLGLLASSEQRRRSYPLLQRALGADEDEEANRVATWLRRVRAARRSSGQRRRSPSPPPAAP
jgi:hypothetical protein